MKKVITVWTLKGGAGKSTTVWHLAIALICLGYKVDVLDGDMSRMLLNVDYIRSGAGLEPLGVQFISNEVEFDEAIEQSQADFILCDLGGFDTELNRYIISKSDLNICPIKDGLPEALGFKNFFEDILSEIGYPKMYFLFTNVRTSFSGGFKDIKSNLLFAFNSFANLKPDIWSSFAPNWLESIIYQRLPYVISMSSGKGVSEVQTTSTQKAKLEISTLAAEIIEVLNGK